MNKTQLVDALTARIGDRRTAAAAVDGLLETIVDTVGAGEPVSITGFGVFESRARAARVARNPRTGETVEVPATTVPAFRPGSGFRTKVGGGSDPAPRAAPPHRPAAAPRSAAADPVPVEPAAPAPKSTTARSSSPFAAPAPAKAAKGKPPKAKDDKTKKPKAKK